MKNKAIRWRVKTALLTVLLAPLSLGASPWEQISSPSNHQPQAVGSYANGCLMGAATLPLQGSGYQVLRSQNRRYFGHPKAVDFIERFAQRAQQSLETNLLVGDISLPQGGRFSSGHSSHQTGLDIDIWFKLADERLSADQLSHPEPLSVVNLKRYRLIKHHWQERHFELIKMAASDRQVARIFVHPVVKDTLCRQEGAANRDWLRKVRPWWGHHYHMHVRLKCPEGSPECLPQKGPPEGDGCGSELSSWKPQPKPAIPQKAQKPAQKKAVKVMPLLCKPLVYLDGN
ncbi:penicillin-insensitive murein endopeptidase [Vibrio ostreicida]|uniref:penicillin-insensitive murein endopeptidase n=1 Tax=Vibrio ostreicida TaxID=526588 RepID=UPI000970E845|nr:penicillin-insensitive murein endopeptidase [Vibrio ostreicida]